MAPSLLLCRYCLDELEELAVQGGGRPLHFSCHLIDISVLFRYQGLVRRLILRAKMKGDHRALLLLISLAARQPVAASVIAWSDTVMPGPASLWGRLRGRLDLASQLAAQLASPRHARVWAPLHLHWRWQKHAQLARGERRDAQLPRWLQRYGTERCHQRLTHLGTQRLLLIDDIITSGGTLERLATATHGSGKWLQRGLVLAAS